MTGAPYGSDAPAEPDAATAPPAPVFELRARLLETVVLVASVVALRIVGLVLIVLSTSSPGSDPLGMLLPFVAMVVDPNLLVWVALAAAVQFGLRSMPRPGRMALVVAAAPVAVLLVGTVRALPMLPQSGPIGLLGNGVSWFDAGILTVVVALGVAVAAAAGTAPVAGARRWAAPVAGGLLALGGLLVLILAWQAIEAYFTLGGTPVVVTPEQGDRYLVTAGLAVVAFAGAVVSAVLSRRRWLVVTSVIVGGVGLILAFVLQVPAGRFLPGPAPEPAPGPGGSSCYGEGDPNCIGG